MNILEGKEISRWFRSTTDGSYDYLYEKLKNANEIYIVGGSVFDYLRNSNQRKDLDIVVDGIKDNEFYSLGEERNIFGGLLINHNGLSIDIWMLKDHYPIKKFNTRTDLQGFMDGAPFNIDKIALGMKSQNLYDDGCLDGIKNKVIDYNPLNPYFEHLQALRAITKQIKSGFEFTKRTKEMLRRVSEDMRKDDSLWREAIECMDDGYKKLSEQIKKELFSYF